MFISKDTIINNFNDKITGTPNSQENIINSIFTPDDTLSKDNPVDNITNEYYTSKNIYIKQITENKINILNQNTNENICINIDDLCKSLNEDDKNKIKNILLQLPAEVLVDVSKELTFNSKKVPKRARGSYYPNNDSIRMSGGDYSVETLVHELGHALDNHKKINSKKRFYETDHNKAFKKAFYDELKKYLKEENHSWGKIIKDSDGQDNYCTINSQEMFATCYALLMLGDCQSRKVIEKYFPRTLEAIKSIIENIRTLDDECRH